MAKRHLEFCGGGSEKFWKINQSASSFTVTFGRIGTNGQTQTKEFDTPAKAKAAADKLITEKLGKGYMDAGRSGAQVHKQVTREIRQVAKKTTGS